MEKKIHPGDVARSKELLRSPCVVKRTNSRPVPEINGDNEGRGDRMSADLNDIRLGWREAAARQAQALQMQKPV